jgi:catechol 2,3-dioxygenase-like lactoylglutathione lyase family enzyme
MKRALSLVLEHKIAKPGRNQGRRFPRSTVRLTRPKLVNDQRLDEDRALGDGDSLLAFFEYPKGIAKVDRDAIGAMQHVSFACGPTRYREILERLKANGVTINAGPLLVIPPAIHSFYFFDPNGIRLEISSDLDGDEEDLQVIRSCSMSETELRAELETISTDKAWVDDMVAAMTSHGLGPVVPSAS